LEAFWDVATSVDDPGDRQRVTFNNVEDDVRAVRETAQTPRKVGTQPSGARHGKDEPTRFMQSFNEAIGGIGIILGNEIPDLVQVS
jgi:hypothetical protein